MPLELQNGKNNCTIIFNSENNLSFDILKNDFNFLKTQKQSNKKTLILSDFSKKNDSEIINLILNFKFSRIFFIENKNKIFQDFDKKKFFFQKIKFFFEKKFSFQDEIILLEGDKKSHLKKIVYSLQEKNHNTHLEINLKALINNLNFYRNIIKKKTKIMVMVKAFSYGIGSFEIAALLESEKVDYLAVAYSDEGIELRKNGINLPIVVLNSHEQNFNLMVKNNLEIEIYSLRILKKFHFFLKKIFYKKKYPIHIKIDTGMNRLGFVENEIDLLIEKLKIYKNIKIKSIFSHLVGSDEKNLDYFTNLQFEKFEKISEKFKKNFSYSILRHILNSSGIERFRNKQYEMVRLGIGFYGISNIYKNKLQNISSLKTRISQIRTAKINETVSYHRKWRLNKESKIAILPIGYADGLNRKLSNGVGKVFINGKFAKIIGNICMDMSIIDITEIKANENDEVIIFGKEQNIIEIAKKLETIAYEILTSISARVKRIYIF